MRLVAEHMPVNARWEMEACFFYNGFLDSGEIFAVRVVLWTKLSSGFAGVIKLKTETVHCQKELVTCRKIKMYPTELKDILSV